MSPLPASLCLHVCVYKFRCTSLFMCSRVGIHLTMHEYERERELVSVFERAYWVREREKDFLHTHVCMQLPILFKLMFFFS